MATLIVDQALSRIAITASRGPGYSSSRYFRSISIDDSTTAFTESDTNLGSPTTLVTDNLDSVTLPSFNRVRHTATFPTTVSLTVRRVALHDDAATNVTGISDTLAVGIDGLNIVKTTDYFLKVSIEIIYSRP